MAACSACGEEHPSDAARCPRTGEPVTGGPCGTRIDRYVVERLLGGGGMGAVYRARHAMLGQAVALKLLRPKLSSDVEAVQRFLREAKAAASIGDPHIVRVLDFGSPANGPPFLVMELLEGQDLHGVIDARGPLALEEAVDLACQILEGLGAAHDAKIVHRDMKPANVFLTHPPDEPAAPATFVKLLDFGISKMSAGPAAQTLTRTGVVMGTPYYMAPEQARGVREIDHRVDLYATAVILYQMLSRALPFAGDSYEDLVIHICTGSPVPLQSVAPEVPPAVVLAVGRGMARAPGERFASARAFADALRAAVGTRRGATAVQAMPLVSLPSAPAAGLDATSPDPSAERRARMAPTSVTPPPAARARWGLPIALVLLSVSILAAAGVGLWIFTRTTATALPVPPPAAPTYPIALVPQTAAPVSPPAAAGLPVLDDDDDFAGMLQGIPDMNEINEAVSMMPVPPAPDPIDGVGLGEPYVVGPMPATEILAAMRRVRRSLDDCRLPGRLERVRVGATILGNGSVMMNPYAGSRGDPGATACVANRFRDAAPFDPRPEASIVYIEVTLAPR